MILDKLVLENFAIYHGRQEMVLNPPGRSKPVVLIHGLNGTGKTTLLDSLHLVLYGSRAQTSNRNSMSYRGYLRSCIHKNADFGEGSRIELSFRRFVNGREQLCQIVRSWYDSGGGETQERFEVTRDHQFDSLLSENWDEFIEGYLPLNIARLFFFDGEQIRQLAERAQARELLKTAIDSLLGADLIAQLESDLRTLERRKKRACISKVDREYLQTLESELLSDEAQLDAERENRAGVQTQFERKQKELEDLGEEYRREGGDLFEKRDELLARRDALEQKGRDNKADVVAFLGGTGPLTLACSLLEKIEKQTKRELEIKKQALLAEATEERDTQVLDTLKASGVPGNYLTLLETVFDEHRPRKAKRERSRELGGDETLIAAIRRLQLQIPHLRNEAKALRKNYLQIGEEHDGVEEKLAAVPDQESIAKLYSSLQNKQKEVEKLAAELDVCDDKIDQLTQQLSLKKTQFKKEVDKAVEAFGDGYVSDRLQSRSVQIRSTLEEFRKQIIANHLGKIERLIADSVSQLLRKTNLVDEVKINPESFELMLSAHGETLDWDRFSSGERQLLATAMLWGLARASGRPIPTIIDTPLGRLDSTHRQRLIANYFPVASHQAILLSTDEEIDDRYMAKLDKYIGRKYILEFDNEGTSIKSKTSRK